MTQRIKNTTHKELLTAINLLIRRELDNMGDKADIESILKMSFDERVFTVARIAVRALRESIRIVAPEAPAITEGEWEAKRAEYRAGAEIPADVLANDWALSAEPVPTEDHSCPN